LGIIIRVEVVEVGTARQDRWWVKTKTREFAIPAVSEFVERVDVEGKKIWVKNFQELMA